MKLLAFLILTTLTIACATTKKSKMNSDNLNGTWIPVRLEIDGKDLPAGTFEKQKLILNDSAYTFIAESVDKGVAIRKGNKMDIYGRDRVNAGKHFTALYKLENGQLTICYNLAGDRYPEAFETKAKPTFFLCTFKKE
jgi:uncharacterized protein (TIGR03067 family)